MVNLPSVVENYLPTEFLPSHADPKARADRKKFEKEQGLFFNKSSYALYAVVVVAAVAAGCYSLKSKAVEKGIIAENGEKEKEKAKGRSSPSRSASAGPRRRDGGGGRSRGGPPDDDEGYNTHDPRVWGDEGWYGRQKERERIGAETRWDGESKEGMQRRERARRRKEKREEAEGREMDVGGGGAA